MKACSVAAKRLKEQEAEKSFEDEREAAIWREMKPVEILMPPEDFDWLLKYLDDDARDAVNEDREFNYG